MGQKDLTQKNLEAYPDVYADTINALLYDGEQVLFPQDLQSAPTETLYRGKKESFRNQFHDVSKYVMQKGQIKAQYTLENELRANSKTILRKAGYEGAVYREQYEGKTHNIYPVISLVLHWGKKQWKSTKALLDFFQSQNTTEYFVNYIDDIKLHVFDMRFLTKEIRQRFTSDMRIVVDYLAEGNCYTPTNQPILHIEAFLLLMKELSGDSRYEQLIPDFENDRKGGITMCELLDKYEAKGEQRVNQLISLLLKQSRWEDIDRAVNNREYQQTLFKQYGI